MKGFLLVMGVILLVGCVPSQMRVGKNGLPVLCETFVAEGPDELSDTYVANREFWKVFNNHFHDSAPRKLVVFMDGTGNDKLSHTNVRRLYRLAVQQACSGNRVVPYYDKGVGSKWFDRVRGGLAGRGTSLNIRQAYRFLVEAYNPGDEIYLIGFSRGSFTARSLNGFIRFAGLIKRESVEKKLYDHIPFPGVSHLHFAVGALYDKYHVNFDGTPNFEIELKEKLGKVLEEQGVTAYDSTVGVKAIGLFDTVPALGLFRDNEPDDHRIDLYAEYGFHALSLDEQRDDFRLLRFNPWKAEGARLQEVWFAGVHSDIGGSYSKTFNCEYVREHYRPGLGVGTLNWMIKNFEQFKVFTSTSLPGKEYGECPGGSLHDELFGGNSVLYKWTTLGTFPRIPRQGDVVHRSVIERLEIPSLEAPLSEREISQDKTRKQYFFLGLQGKDALNRFFPRDPETKTYSKELSEQAFRIYEIERLNERAN